jgi:Tol biopolymer transport system component
MHGVNAPNGNDATGAGQFAISESGTLLYASGGGFPMRLGTLTWVDRSGAAQPVDGAQPRMYLSPRISPDGQKVAVETKAEENQPTDLWVFDVARRSPTRVTFDGGSRPVWSRDGRRLVYSHGSSAALNLFVVNADGSGKPEQLTTSERTQSASSWAADLIAFMQRPTPDTFGIWVLPMAGPAARQPSLFLESRFNMTYPELSPDGKWMAYVSYESGPPEVYVQPYPGAGEKLRISTEVGFEPIWTANGKEILFRSWTKSGGQQYFSAAVRSLSPLRVDPPRKLFEAKTGEYDSTVPNRAWDATADGQKFLVVRVSESTDQPVAAMHVVLNWTEELKRRVPAR